MQCLAEFVVFGLNLAKFSREYRNNSLLNARFVVLKLKVLKTENISFYYLLWSNTDI